MKNQRLLYAGLVLAVIIVIPVAWYLLSPLWINVQVDESFPIAMPAEVNAQAAE